MPDELSTDADPRGPAVFTWRPWRRIMFVIMGYVPLVHVAMVIALPVAAWRAWLPTWTAALAPIVLYVLPAVIVRATLLVHPLKDGRYALDSGTMLVWWWCGQWQVVFNRLPLLEELLRLVPGLYSTWLRLWGAKVGGLVYWSPGTCIIDRSLAIIGRRVVFGIGARLHPHVIDRDGDTEEAKLILGTIRIDNEALIGGMSLLGPGVHVHAGEVSPGIYALPPFAEWRGGKRLRGHHTLIRT